ncbi:methyl-accepting chemotaxis protein, partial [Lichenihabitans sp. Uapishka_5]|uniref:methyl-accepting chemotaxis protein n=1 Tax=Lichenihabitans sp. Uapishka_5 TaxID=3037302 RepID=UPI0029E7F000
MRFKDIGLAGKLSLGFGSVLAVVALSSAFTYASVKNVAEVERLNTASNLIQDEVDQAWGSMARSQAAVRKYVLTAAASDKAKVDAGITAFRDHVAKARAALVADAPVFVADLDAYRTASEAYLNQAILQEVRLATDPATRPQAVDMVSSSTTAPLSAAMDAAETVIETKVDTWSDTFTEAGDTAMHAIVLTVMAASLASVLVGILMAWCITRAVGIPLSTMTRAMRRLAEGDNAVTVPALGQKDELGQMAAAVQVFKDSALAKLRAEAEAAEARREAEALRREAEAAQAEAARQQGEVVDAVSSGLDHLAKGDLTFRLDQSLAPDYEKLRHDFNAALNTLQDAMRMVASNAAAIRAGTNEISTASDDLSRRTEQQAASLEETAAALDEITATVKKTAEGSNHARSAVATAKTDAERSGAVVGRAVAAMTGIEASSKQIGQIIGVIDEIAFQTNLLALNAGVEAAR